MQMTTYLNFKGDWEEAFRFYEQHLGGQSGAIFRYFWAERFGMVVDRFGIRWTINCEPGEATA
jgi:uncharacterized glyoxalase superfamily protein PhnB